MKPIWLAIVALTAGCATKLPNNVVSVTSRTLGFDFAQSPDGLYHLRLGFITTQYHSIPTSTNPIYAAPIYSSIDVGQKMMSTQINEDFATGDGVDRIDNNSDSPAKLGARRLK